MVDFWILILQSFYLLLPAGFANMAPVFFAKINFLNIPVDFNKTINGKRVLGDHKTLRGLFFGTIIAIIIVFIQKSLMSIDFFKTISLIDYDNTNFVLLGFILGFGALLGDMLKSFFKRRIDIAPGKDWFIFDQLDWVLVSLLLLHIIYVPPFAIIAICIVLFLIIHILIKQIGYFLRLDKKY